MQKQKDSFHAVKQAAAAMESFTHRHRQPILILVCALVHYFFLQAATSTIAAASSISLGAGTSDYLAYFYHSCNASSTNANETMVNEAQSINKTLGTLQERATSPPPSSTSLPLFSNISANDTAGLLYAAYQCRGDLTQQECVQCVTEAARFSMQNCSNKLGQAYVLLDGCMVRYQSTAFFNLDTTSLIWGCSADQTNDGINYGEDAGKLINTVIKEAPAKKGLFSASLVVDGTIRVYGVAQCVGYLAPDQCRYCLASLAGTSSKQLCGPNPSGMRVHYPSCFFRFENFPFFKEASIGTISASPPPGGGSNIKGNINAILGIVGGLIGLALLIASCIYIFSRKSKAQKLKGNRKVETYVAPAASQAEVFSFHDLKDASSNFHSANKLGEGGYGSVYKGVLWDAREVAIKKLHAQSQQGEEEFKNEVNIITTVQHRNLIRLFGCCAEGFERLLVYEYLKNQSLDKHLFDCDGKRDNLKWGARYEIITGIARGLAYLHEDSRVRIVHRDIKPSNILLDNNLSPKIADFGLARLFPNDETHVSTKIAGTFGYLAPEYAMHGKLTEKNDIFSFGLVALETISGRRNLDGRYSEGLLELAWRLHQGKGQIEELVDPKLMGNWMQDDVIKVVRVALLCLQEKQEQRPPMSRVVSMLSERFYDLDIPTKPSWISGTDGVYSTLHSTSLCPR